MPDLRVVPLPTCGPSDAAEIERIMGELLEMHEAGKLAKLVVVAFNPLGGWQFLCSENLRLSQLTIAGMVLQREAFELMDAGKEMPYPAPTPAA